MAETLMTARDFEPINTKEKFIEAVLRFEPILGDEVPNWVDLGVPESEFQPLDQNVKNEIDRLTGRQVQDMFQNWINGWRWDGLPESLSGSVDAWRQHLTISCVGAYCAATGAFIRSLLLDASAEIEAKGLIDSPLEAPTLFIFPKPGSILARDEGIGNQDNRKRISPSQFANRIALRCGEPRPWGELAWRYMAASFITMEAYEVLPRISIRKINDKSLEVRL